MDPFGDASPTSVPTPQSPPAPLALSEFMAQTAPFSDTTNPSDTPPLPLDISRREVVEEEPSRVSEQDKAQSQIPEQQTPAPQAPPCTPDSSPPPTDWLATRQQLLPRRNQGKKADWIRGWCQAVSIHGEETYCACSETVESVRGRKGKTSDLLAGNVRAILQRAGSPANNKPPTPSEPELCRNCSRLASPPPPSTGISLAGERYGLAGGRSFSRRVSELLMRVRAPRPNTWRSKSEHHKRGHSGGGGKVAWLPTEPECQPRWATTGQGQKRFLVRPPSQPVPAPASAPVHKAWSMDIFPGHARRRSNLYTPSSETSDSDGAPRPGLSRSMSRLQRAAALLQKATSRPKD